VSRVAPLLGFVPAPLLGSIPVPLLGFIPSPPVNGFHVGPLFVHAYGLAYVVGICAAVAIAIRRWEALGGSRDLVYEVALWGFPAGVVGGRLYFLATSWSEVPRHWWGPFAIWDGGLGIWGGVALGTLAGIWVLRRRGADVALFMDAAAPALLVAQAIGRIGNYFNQELFGGPTTLPWALEISPAHRPAGYARYATFHPTFLYELIWNLLLAGALVWLGRRRRIKAPGLFALYVAGYSFARIGEELLRVDPAHRIFGLRLNFYVATILCLVGVVWFLRIQRPRIGLPRALRRGGGLLAAAGALCLVGCGHAAPAHASAGAGRAAMSSSRDGSCPDGCVPRERGGRARVGADAHAGLPRRPGRDLVVRARRAATGDARALPGRPPAPAAP
jgi:prolipoprotein diacylglyceryl transferase